MGVGDIKLKKKSLVEICGRILQLQRWLFHS